MNRNYRVIFNHSLGVWQCVSEIAKACGKRSSKVVKATAVALVVASSSVAMAEEKALDDSETLTTSSDHNDTINIATTKDKNVTIAVTGENVVRSMSATGDGEKWIGVGQYGKGTLNIDNGAKVFSNDSIILGVMGDEINQIAHGQGTVNLSNNANLSAQNYLIIGDGGNGILNVNGGSSQVIAKNIALGTQGYSVGVINLDNINKASGANKAQVHAHESIVVGTGTINVKNDAILSTNRLIMGSNGTANLNVTTGGNVVVNNIERGEQAKSVNLSFDGDIKIEGGNQYDFFKGFTSTDDISFKQLEFNTNGYDVTINPNAIIRGNNVSKFNVHTGGGFEKSGKGKLSISEGTLKNVSEVSISEGILEYKGSLNMLVGDTLNIALKDADNYGQFHVTNNLDISKGALNVYASDVVKTLVANNSNATWQDVVKAGTLTGQFAQFKVLDNQGNTLNSTLAPEYRGNAVNLVVGTPNNNQPTPSTPPVNTNNDGIIDQDHTFTQSHSYADDIQIAPQVGQNVDLKLNNGLSLNMTANTTNEKFIHVGQRGQGTLNVDNAIVNSLDGIILGSNVKTDTINGVTTKTHAKGTVNLSNNAKLIATNYLIVGDGGHGELNVNGGSSYATAKNISLANDPNSIGIINLDNANKASGANKATVHADETIVVGSEGTGTINVKNDAILSTNRLIMGGKGTATVNASSGANISVNNIERGEQAKAVNLLLNGADIKIEGGNQSNFFKDFTSKDNITIGSYGLDFNTNGHDVTINPNATIVGNMGKYTLDPRVGFYGGFHKRGDGTLTISENTLKNTSGDITVDRGILKLDGNFKFDAGESLNIALREGNDYGKFHVTGNLDVSQGALNVYASDVIKDFISNSDNQATWQEAVRAGKLTGQFTAFKVMDNKGNAINSTLTPEYTATSVNLVAKAQANTVTPPVVVPPKTIGVVNVGTNTITHTGDFITQSIDDEVRIRLENANTYGRLNITGKADFSKGHLSVQASDLVRSLVQTTSTDWKDVITTAGRTGEFARFDVVDNNGTTISSTIKPVYDGNNVHLTAQATTPPVTPPVADKTTKPVFTAVTERQQAPSHSVKFAGALDNIVAKHADTALAKTLNAISVVVADDEKINEIVEQLAPVVNTQATQLVSEQQNVATATVTDRIFQTRSDISQGSDNDGYSLFKRSQDLSNQVWIQGIGQTHRADTTAQSSGYKGDSSGIVIGADGLVNDNLRVGVALSYSNSDIDTKTANAQNLKSKMLQGFAYGDYAYGNGLSINGFVGIGNANIDTKRTITTGIVDATATADYDSKTTQVGVGVDYRMGKSAHDHVSPYAQVRYAHTSTDGYSESTVGILAEGIGIKSDKTNSDTWTGTLGVHFAKPVSPRLQAIGHLAGQLESTDNKAVNMAFVGASDATFAQEAPKQDRYATQLGLGLRYQPSINTEISGQYQGQFSKNTDNHGISMLFKYKF